MNKAMYALNRDAIKMLANKFIIANDDMTRHDIVSCLGFSAYNHAHFILQLERLCGPHPTSVAWEHMRRAYFDIVSQGAYVSEPFEPVEY